MHKDINRIKLLPEFVVNQIAAGEVIERPASILKELLENSIDANSTIIRVYLENGGITSIKVVDNGDGIHPEDLPLVFKQHATSKITTANDLANISSLGFRGEALASIQSVAITTVLSNQEEPRGTTIEVRNLFYNTPARRKFLRSSKTEFNYSQELLKRIALSNFSVGFIFYHNNKLIKNLPACIDSVVQKEKRLTKLCGKKFVDHATYFNVAQNGLELSGWISNAECVAGSSIQYFYINNRIVKDKLLSGAIRQVTQKLSLPNVYCLYLNLDPSLVDVNVHPTKQEVRFRDPKIIYAFVYENILEVLTGKSNASNLFNSNSFSYEILPETSEEFVQNQNMKLFSVFNNQYVIFEQEQNSYRELIFLYVPTALKWLVEKKLQETNMLSNYQLIIPERIKINCNDNLDSYIKFLEKFKFIVDQIHEDVLLIKAIPNCLSLLKIEINYKDFLLDFFRIKSDLVDSLSDLEFINLLVFYIKIDQYASYTKQDLVLLIKELTSQKYCFSAWNEKQISSLVK